LHPAVARGSQSLISPLFSINQNFSCEKDG